MRHLLNGPPIPDRMRSNDRERMPGAVFDHQLNGAMLSRPAGAAKFHKARVVHAGQNIDPAGAAGFLVSGLHSLLFLAVRGLPSVENLVEHGWHQGIGGDGGLMLAAGCHFGVQAAEPNLRVHRWDGNLGVATSQIHFDITYKLA